MTSAGGYGAKRVLQPEVQYHQDMAQVHMTEAELARDVHAALEKVRHGDEVIIEHDHKPVARIMPARGPGRPVAECIAIAEELGSKIPPDDEFGRDLEEIIADRKPLDTSQWE